VELGDNMVNDEVEGFDTGEIIIYTFIQNENTLKYLDSFE
jgi:hypothetical protein